MPDQITCPNCSEEVTADSDFCLHCGILFVDEKDVLCDEHPAKSALGVCIICQKLICDECGVETGGRNFCFAHQKVKVQENWAEVFRSTEIADAEMVKSMLESTGLKVLEQNFSPGASIWEGSSSIWRSNMNKPVKVLVPIQEYLQAMEVVYDWRSSQTAIPFDETEM